MKQFFVYDNQQRKTPLFETNFRDLMESYMDGYGLDKCYYTEFLGYDVNTMGD